MLLGLRTAIYRTPDLEAGKRWYTKVLGAAPYFDQPFYVGYNIGGYELGLLPDATLNTAGVYWGVKDAKSAYSRLLELGAEPRTEVQNVGEGILAGDVLDPFGNVFGVIENPHFKLPAEVVEMKHAKGSFDVTLQPLPNTEVSSHPLLGRMLLVKKFSGDLVADARGQMLSAGTNTRGSACYVAIDHVTGTIEGRTGGFLLQHCGTMNRGEPSLSIQVVPDSGTEDLVGLTGTLRINIVEGKHFYEFDYQLPDGLPDRS